MFADISYLLPWLLLSVLLGGFVGWRTESPDPAEGPVWQGNFRYVLIALAVAFLLGLFDVFSGRFEFWLESAVWFVIAYLIGAFAGGAIQRSRAA